MPEKNILIADDDAPIREVLIQALKTEDYLLFEASDGKEAVEIAQNNPIDVAILDIRMPQMDGVEVLKRIKEIDKTIEVVMITGYIDFDSLREVIFDHGAFDYLLKPFDIVELKLTLKKALRNKKLMLKRGLLKDDLKNRILELENDFRNKTYELRKSQIKYRNIVENSTDAIVITQGKYIKFANKRALESSGYSKEEMFKLPFIRILHPDDRPMTLKSYQRWLSGEDVPGISTFRITRKDGSSFWIENHVTRTLWGGKPAALNSIRDISERMKAEEPMMRAEKLSSLGQLAGGLAHELKNPLAVISSCSQFCLENMKLERLVRENFQVIRRNTKRASKLINELLAFAKPDHLEQKEVDVNEVLLRMLRMARLEIDHSHTTFVERLKKRLPKLRGDEEKLSQVFLNLIQNAIQAVSGNGEIVLQTGFIAPDNMVEVKVIDNGPGIPEEYRKRIFDPFFTTKDEGTGLGLTICHSIVEQHRGGISVECGEQGGTRISVRLPVKQKMTEGI